MRVISDPGTEARLTAAVIPTNMLCNLAQLAREQTITQRDPYRGAEHQR